MMSTMVLGASRSFGMASLHQATIERLGWTLVHFVWQATAVALLLAIVLYLLRRASSNARYITSCLALVLVLALPVVTIQFIEVSGPAAEAGPPPAHPAVADVAPTPVLEVSEMSMKPTDATPAETVDSASHTSWREHLAAKLQPALPYLVLGWLVGVFGLSAWHLGGWAQLQRLKRRMTQTVSAPLQDKLGQLAARLGIRRTVGLLESALVEVPTVVGWIKPVVLLPASALTGLNADQLEAILAHELAHVRRCDYPVNILQTVVEILGFYHPAVWWVSQRIRDERENCCDDLAVRVCGDSVCYARALTHLEEMRHRGMELAVAATGGSLVTRIGRLIGRPVIDDRRFAWLPGLIALVLVASIVIPAALVLAAPASEYVNPAASEPPTEEVVAMNDIPRTQVLLSFAVVDISPDQVLDPETAAAAQGLLTQASVGDTGAASGPPIPPTVAELRQPLRDVFARFVPIRDKSKELVDLLVTRGYATVVSRPKILTSADKPATILVGDVNDPNVPDSQWSGLKLTVLADVLDQQDATRLEINFESRVPIGDPEDRYSQMSSTQIASTLVVPNEQYAALVAQGTGGANAPLLLLLIGPTRVNYPAPPLPSRTGLQNQTVVTRGRGARRGQTDLRAQGDPNEPQVLMTFVLAKVLTGATLDRETLLSVAAVVGEQGAQAASDIADPTRTVTLGEILNKYVARKVLPTSTVDALVDVLLSQGYLEMQAQPVVMTKNNQQVQIRTSAEEYFKLTEDATPPRTVELGISLSATPHVASLPREQILLEVQAQWTRQALQARPDGRPAIRMMEMATTALTEEDQCLSLLLGPGQEEDAETKDPESVLIVVKPTGIPGRPSSNRPAMRSRADVRGGIPTDAKADTDDGTDSDMEATATNTNARQALLEVRTVVLQKSDPPRQGRSVRPVSAEDGREARIVAFTGEQFPLDSPGIEQSFRSRAYDQGNDSGILLSITPHIESEEGVTVDIVAEVSYLVRPPQGSGTPLLRRRTVENSCTIPYGGTVAAIGLTDNPAGRQDEPGREVAVFVTAQRDQEPQQELDNNGLNGRIETNAPSAAQADAAETPAVQIGMRLLSVSDEFVDALKQGLPLAGVKSPADVNALREIGEGIAQADRTTLDKVQLGALLKAVQASEDAKSLASPKVTVLSDETAQFRVAQRLSYIDGYSEPNDVSSQPTPEVKEVPIGVEMTITPSILAAGRIGLDAKMTLTSVVGYEEKTYKDTLDYRVPKIDKIEFSMEDLWIPDGDSLLVVGPRAKPATGRDDAGGQSSPTPLLIVFTVKETAAPETENPSLRPMDGAMPGVLGGYGVGGPQEFSGGYGSAGVNPTQPEPAVRPQQR